MEIAQSQELTINAKTPIESEQSALDTVKSIFGKKLELKRRREMLNDNLNSDEEYTDITAQIKELQKTRKMIKKRIMTSVMNKNLEEEIKVMKKEVKSEQLSLSDYLDAYSLATGSDYLEDPTTGLNYRITKKLSVARTE